MEDDACRESRLTGHVRDASALSCSTRRSVLKGLALSLAAALVPRPVRADLFGGDIGVLLAQLEQAYQIVSNGIRTVQNLMETVNRLGKVVQNSKTLLEHAQNGGLEGILDAAQGFVGIAQGVTSRLRVTNNDTNWWIHKISPLVTDKEHRLSAADQAALESQLAESDRERIRGAKRINAWYDRLKEQYAALEASSKAVKEGNNANGVVAQMQLANRQQVQAQSTLLAGVEMQTVMAANQEEEYMRQATIRETTRKRKDKAKKGLKDTSEPQPVNFDIQLGQQWGGGHAETGLGEP